MCCLCGINIDANPTGMCNACAKSQVNIADGITTTAVIYFCKGCDRYQRPPWVRLPQESNDMMAFLISKLKGLKQVKLIDSNFIWTEPHSKRKKIKLTLQKEFNNTLLQTAVICEFTEEWTQCDDCKKTFTPHLWNASCQVRQKVNHKRTFLYLEQAVLKHKMHEKALSIKETPEGVDFYFKNRSHANAFSDFAHSLLPCKVKDSKRLVSHDQWSNLYNYKYSYMIEIAPVCKDDLIILSKEQSKELGGIGPVLLCYKTSANVHLLDPLTFEILEFDENTYWKYNFRSHIDRSTLQEFLIQNIEEEIDYKEKYSALNMSITVTDLDVEMNNSKLNQSKSTNYKATKKILINPNTGQKKDYFNKRENHKFKIVKVDCTKINTTQDGELKLYTFRCQLGDKIRVGDVVYGYDIGGINTTLYENNDELNTFPEIVLVKKKFFRGVKRFWKLKRMEMENDNNTPNVEDVEGEDLDTKKRGGKKNKLEKISKRIGKANAKNAEDQYEEFLRDIEEDREMRKNINIYKDEDVMKELTEKLDNMNIKDLMKKNQEDFGIAVEELMQGLKIDGGDDEYVDTTKKSDKVFKEPLSINEGGKKKIKLADRAVVVTNQVKDQNSQLKCKRDRKGSEIASSGNEHESN